MPQSASFRCMRCTALRSFWTLFAGRRWCDAAGVSSFSAAVRTLCFRPAGRRHHWLSTGVGKKLLVRHFVGSQEGGGRLLPTTGFVCYEKMVSLMGSAIGHVMLHTYDTPGEPRFGGRHRFICPNSHTASL
ncbi:small GTP-binding protein Rab7 [Trypanosoma rangeli]|uniref:Small GTP-binding protein Rab7 n=1 Tax=Trypanosoma rangeli TaxID=5698 RepID=A0A422NJX9_TRYRA|nr:small GTP-binding protein Rab7 [Trypanosoma rangeli]RNF05766.1 small GTP-binding protein Rab7 [Trypanosoma rangeli]|eukprot:RNF05766.1 small GTP-binding protein Rab7 [Trypanosoma rangeli]